MGFTPGGRFEYVNAPFDNYATGTSSTVGVNQFQRDVEEELEELLPGGGAGTGDFSSNASTSIDGEVVLFSGTGGKMGRRATETGIPKLVSGVLFAASAGVDYETPANKATDFSVLNNTKYPSTLAVQTYGDARYALLAGSTNQFSSLTGLGLLNTAPVTNTAIKVTRTDLVGTVIGVDVSVGKSVADNFLPNVGGKFQASNSTAGGVADGTHPTAQGIRAVMSSTVTGRLDFGHAGTFEASHGGSGHAEVVVGTWVQSSIYGSGSVGSVFGIHAEVVFSGSAWASTSAPVIQAWWRSLGTGNVPIVYGVKIGGPNSLWTKGSATVTTSYGLYMGADIDVGTTRWAIYSLSTSASLLSGDLTVAGILTTGTGPTTLTNAAGGILPTALVAGIDAAKIADGSVSNTEFQYLNSVTSNVQTQLNDKASIAYADSLVVGLLDDRGNYSASGNVFPSTGGSGGAGAILKGDLWFISVAGTLGGVAVNIGDQVRALVDTPGQTASNWAVAESNIGYVPLNQAMASGTIYLGNGSGIGTAVTPTGDVTINNAGVTAIGALKVVNAMIANATIDLTTKVTGILPAANGGTGINNATRTLTISTNAGTIAFPGAATVMTFPSTSATLARIDAGNTFTGNQTFVGSLFPSLPDTYDLGSATLLWRKGWLSELDTILFAENTISVIGGWQMIAKGQGTVEEDVDTSETQIDFGTNNIAASDFIVFRSSLAVEYMQATSVVSGTIWNVTRSVDPGAAVAWPKGAVWVNFGYNGTGRIELNATDTPRISMIRQGVTYNAQTELLRVGDLNGGWGYVAETYGFAVGDAAATNVTMDATNGFRIRFGSTNKLVADASGNLSLVGDMIIGTSGAFRSGATTFHVGAGYYMDYNLGTPRFRIGAGYIGSGLSTNTNIVGGTFSSGTFTKTAADLTWGNSGFSSAEAITGDGYIQWTATEAEKYRAVGLSTSDPDQHKDSILYGFFLVKAGDGGGGTLWITESGSFISGVAGSFIANTTVLKIERIGTTLTYYKDGVAVRVVAGVTTSPLYLDTAVYTINGTVGPVTILSNAKGISWDGSNLIMKATNFALDSSGNITATGGTVGAWTIGATRLSSPNVYIDQPGQYISMGTTPPTSYAFKPIALVTSGNAGNYSGGAVTSLAAPAFVATAGNLIVVYVTTGNVAGAITVTDTAGNTYTAVSTVTTPTDGLRLASFYAKNITGHAANIVTAAFASRPYVSIVVAQYSGIDQVDPLDASATGTGAAATSVTSGSFTTTQTNELLVAGALTGNAATAMVAGAGYTLENGYAPTTNRVSGLEDKLVTSIQTGVTASMSSGTAANWGLAVMTFKAAALPGVFLEGANGGRMSLYKDADNYLQWNNSTLSMAGSLRLSGSASNIAIGTVPPTSAAVGTGIWIDRTGMYGLDANVVQAKFDAVTGKIIGGAGIVTIGVSGIDIQPGLTAPSKISWGSAGYINIFTGVTGVGGLWSVTGVATDDNDNITIQTSSVDSGFVRLELFACGSTHATLPAKSWAAIRSGSGINFKGLGISGAAIIPNAMLDIRLEDAATATMVDMQILDHNTTGTAAIGFGTSIVFKLETADAGNLTYDAARVGTCWSAPNYGSGSSLQSFWVTQVRNAGVMTEIARFGNVSNFFKGANVASAAAIVPTGNLFHVTGTTNITSITATGIQAGAVITMIFDGILTVTDGSNLKLAGNFVTTADDTLTVAFDGTNFYELCRSVN